MRSWIYDVELDLLKNKRGTDKSNEKFWYVAFLSIMTITIVYISLYSSNKSSSSITKRNQIFFGIIFSIAGLLILFSIAVSIYYLKKLQTIQIEVASYQRNPFKRNSGVRNSHHQGTFFSKTNRSQIHHSNKLINKADSNQSIEEIKNNNNTNINNLNNANLNIQKSSSLVGSPKANKDGKKSNLSSQNSLNNQQQQHQQQQQQQQQQNQQQITRDAYKKRSSLIQKNKGHFIETNKGKDQNKQANSQKGQQIMNEAASNIVHLTEESNVHIQSQTSLKKQFQLKYVFSTQMICIFGWLAAACHISCIYCFFSKSPFWSTSQIWNGICLFTLFPTHMLSTIIFLNANLNLLIDRSFFIKCIQNNYFFQIFKNSISQIGYISMTLLLISLIWGSIIQIVKNQVDIAAILLLALIGSGFILYFIIKKISEFYNNTNKGYRNIVGNINH
ncbi:transmembrane protein, putative (macronuclear) [Tetrahymena thermophila SB210]|uniref:Transmembrane protein, putative n=1 Tax=Tetrahymena thermophila (strain SB210) TaxID=312017 RepID=W7XK58_TETTS|nr:transmembrane protein, putative [Tetrahymena thermophila SB210]EWS74614.1 transmembrane protein, putative [Tetrahymena thermophila SB210]|eukprot:XP_012652836.1 transmembrane protein, putative [Tetrahymena thermophila SB210]